MDPSETLLRALYVEDLASDIDLTCRALRACSPPIEVEVAQTVECARKLLDERGADHYQWLLFDLSLPDGDGLELLAHMRQARYRFPAIAVTGTGDERAVVRALQLGVDDYVVKQGEYLQALGELMMNARQRHLRLARRDTESVRVLYVENSPQDADLTARYFKAHAARLSLEVFHGSLAEIQARIRQEAFDVLLLDYHLDSLDAFEVIRWMRRCGGPWAEMPIVVVTGRGAEDTAVQALRLGVSDYVIKDESYLQRLPGVIEASHVRSQLVQERDRLEESRSRLEHLTQQVPGFFLVLRWCREAVPPVELAYFSAGARIAFGSDSPDLAWSELRDRIHPEDRARVLGAALRAARSGLGHSVEYRMTRDSGEPIWMESHIAAESIPGKATLLYIYSFDTTQRKQLRTFEVAAEVAKRASAEKSAFLSRVSHELRTPLNALLGFTQLLLLDAENSFTGSQRRSLECMSDAGQHLAALIGDLLDVSAVESGALRLDLQPTSVLAVCESCAELLRGLAREKNVQVRFAVDDAMRQVKALADPLRLRQVIINLLSNAIKYNRDHGEVIIEFTRHAQQVWVHFHDTGIGMTPDQQLHLFEPFNRLGVQGRGIPGAGMGLVVVKRMVDAMGGQTQVRSAAGKGSTFSVGLPESR